MFQLGWNSSEVQTGQLCLCCLATILPVAALSGDLFPTGRTQRLLSITGYLLSDPEDAAPLPERKRFHLLVLPTNSQSSCLFPPNLKPPGSLPCLLAGGGARQSITSFPRTIPSQSNLRTTCVTPAWCLLACHTVSSSRSQSFAQPLPQSGCSVTIFWENGEGAGISCYHII